MFRQESGIVFEFRRLGRYRFSYFIIRVSAGSRLFLYLRVYVFFGNSAPAARVYPGLAVVHPEFPVLFQENVAFSRVLAFGLNEPHRPFLLAGLYNSVRVNDVEIAFAEDVFVSVFVPADYRETVRGFPDYARTREVDEPFSLYFLGLV